MYADEPVTVTSHGRPLVNIVAIRESNEPTGYGCMRSTCELLVPKETRRRVEQARAAGRLRVAAVTLWEIARLVQDGRLRIDRPVPEWLHTALARSGTTVAPLDAETAHDAARAAATLSDPAGCQIVGTAVHLGVPLATRDRRLLECARRLGIEALEV